MCHLSGIMFLRAVAQRFPVHSPGSMASLLFLIKC